MYKNVACPATRKILATEGTEKKNYKIELSSLRSQLDWNDGLLEKWNDGMAPRKERHQTDREWVGGATPFLKNFFKTLKSGIKEGIIARTFYYQCTDIKQLEAYGAEWKKEHPHPGNKSFLVYCFANQGFRVFPM